MKYPMIVLSRYPEWMEKAAAWFHEKWGIPKETYLKSMEESLNGKTIPQGYIVVDRKQIVAGIGVIENDFHERKDLAPNVCAVYVEKAYRNQGIAGKMLDFVAEDMASKGIETLYLLTDHTSFYEKYGWKFLTIVKSDGGEDSRLYVHSRTEK